MHRLNFLTLKHGGARRSACLRRHLWRLVPALLACGISQAQTGTPIAMPIDLDLLRTNPTGAFYLAADLDLGGMSFVPIGTVNAPFRGTFDGNGFEIRNLTVDAGGNDQAGLFGATNGATLSALRVVDATVQLGGRDVGGLVGQARRTTMTDCFVSGVVSGQIQVGGLVGFLGDSDVDACHTDVFVDVGDSSDTLAIWFGGLVGHAHPYRDPGVGFGSVGDGCRITNCSSLGTTQGMAVVGGFAGNFHGSFAQNCVAMGDVESIRGFSGGFAGNVVDEPGNLGTPLVSVVLMDCEANGQVRSLTSGGGTGSSFGFPYDATNGGFAGMIRGNLDVGFDVAVNLERCVARGDVISHEPTHLLPTGGFSGLIEPGSLLVDCRATGDVEARDQPSVGGFVGWGGGLLVRCDSHGDVLAANRCGGFVGQATIGHNPDSPSPGLFKGHFVRCSANGNVTAIGSAPHSTAAPLGVGGFAGNALQSVQLSACSARGSVSASGGGGGGFVGHAERCQVERCSTIGPVFTMAGSCGGFVGTTRDGLPGTSFSDCAARSDVIYRGGSNQGTPLGLGGFIGQAGIATVVQRCFAAGTVTTSGPGVGGFGGLSSSQSFYKACWFDFEAAHQLADDDTGAEGTTTLVMRQQQNYVGWNFQKVWRIDENQSYPELR